MAGKCGLVTVALIGGLFSLCTGTSVAQDGEIAKFGTTVVDPFGLRGRIYALPENTTALPRFENLQSIGSIYTDSLNITARSFTEGFPGVTDRFEWFAIDYTGRFWIDRPGQYRFGLLSDDGSRLYIDDRLIIDNDGIHAPRGAEGKVTLGGGFHWIRVSYFQGPREHVALVLVVAGPKQLSWHIFSTREYKPPVNPDDWKFERPAKPNR